MRKLSPGLIIICSLILLSACREKQRGNFNIAGTYKNLNKLASPDGPVSKVYLLGVPAGKDQNPVALDSAKLTGNSGVFSLAAMTRSQEVYELMFGNNLLIVPLVNDSKELSVDVDLGKKDDFYEVKGSEASSQLKDLITIFGKKNFEVEKALSDLDSLKRSNATDSVLLTATLKKNNAIQDLNTYLHQFINTNGNATLSALALSWSSRSFTKADFETAMSDLVKKYPANTVLQGMKQNYDLQMAQLAEEERRQAPGNSWVGKQAPELSLPDVNGKEISLASFKGKYLLVDFWASWCGPCRGENPNVVKAYHEYKNKNFTILGVSLDKDKDAWQQAIQADQLDWKQVSDLKFWNSKAAEVFGFQGIPFNVLIDPQGKIIGQGLRGEDLENKLKEVLK